MRTLFLTLSLLFGSTCMYAQWAQTTNTKSKTLVYNGGRLIGGGGGAGGILISDDEGTTWTASNSGVPAWMQNDIDPKLSIGDTIFAVAINKLLVSMDNGNTWAEGTTTLPAASIISIVHYDGSVIYVCYQDGKVYASTNGGNTFSLKGNIGIYPVVMVSYNGALYAGTNGAQGMYKSADGGATWAAANTGIDAADRQVYALNIFSGSMYMGTYSGKIYKMDAATSAWTKIYTGSPMRDLYNVNNAIMAATDNGYAASLDNGVTWSASNAGLSGLDLYFLHIYASSSNVFVTKFYGGVLKRSFADLGIGSTTGVSTIGKKGSITLYPNPATNWINANNLTGPFSYCILDVTGQVRATATINKGNTIDISSLAAGIYLIKISSTTGVYTSKIFKQ